MDLTSRLACCRNRLLILLSVKNEGGRVFLPRLVGWRRVLLAERSAGRGSCTGGIGADHTTLIREETPLAGHALAQRRGHKRVGRNGTAGTDPDERVPALQRRVRAEDRINQVRDRGAGRAA